MGGKKEKGAGRKERTKRGRKGTIKIFHRASPHPRCYCMCSMSMSFLGKQQGFSFLLALPQLLLLTKRFTNQNRFSQLFNNSKRWENIAREGQHSSLLTRSLVSKTKCELLRDNSLRLVIPLGSSAASTLLPLNRPMPLKRMCQKKCKKPGVLETFILLDFSLCHHDSYLLVLSLEHLAQPGGEEDRAACE